MLTVERVGASVVCVRWRCVCTCVSVHMCTCVLARGWWVWSGLSVEPAQRPYGVWAASPTCDGTGGPGEQASGSSLPRADVTRRTAGSPRGAQAPVLTPSWDGQYGRAPRLGGTHALRGGPGSEALPALGGPLGGLPVSLPNGQAPRHMRVLFKELCRPSLSIRSLSWGCRRQGREEPTLAQHSGPSAGVRWLPRSSAAVGTGVHGQVSSSP